jgi:hypothetical protein
MTGVDEELLHHMPPQAVATSLPSPGHSTTPRSTGSRTRLRQEFIAQDNTIRQIREPRHGPTLDHDLFPLAALVPTWFINSRLPAVVDHIIAHGDLTRLGHAFHGYYLIQITTPFRHPDGRLLDVFFPLAWRSSRTSHQTASPSLNYGFAWTHFAVEHGHFPQPASGRLPITAAISPHLRHHHGDTTAEALARFIAPIHFHRCDFSAIGTYHPLRWGTFVTGYDPASAELELQDFVGDLITVP